MKKSVLIKHIAGMVNNTPFASITIPTNKMFSIREYENDVTTIPVVGVETADNETFVVTSDGYEILLQDMTYRELEMVYKAIK